MTGLIWKTKFVLKRTLKYGLQEVVNQLPDIARYEVQRFIVREPHVVKHYDWDTPYEYVWRCPDPNYPWHYTVDDQGFYPTSDEAWAAGEAHWKQWHQGLWPGAEEATR